MSRLRAGRGCSAQEYVITFSFCGETKFGTKALTRRGTSTSPQRRPDPWYRLMLGATLYSAHLLPRARRLFNSDSTVGSVWQRMNSDAQGCRRWHTEMKLRTVEKTSLRRVCTKEMSRPGSLHCQEIVSTALRREPEVRRVCKNGQG